MSKIKANAKNDDEDRAKRMTTVDALRTLAATMRLKGGETVLQAVQRLGKEMKAAKAVASAAGQGGAAGGSGATSGGGAKGWRAKRARQKAEAAVGWRGTLGVRARRRVATGVCAFLCRVSSFCNVMRCDAMRCGAM